MPSSGILRRVALVRTYISGKFLLSVLRLLVNANIFASSPIFVTLKMETIRSSETYVLRRAIRCNIPEDGNLDSDCRQTKYLT
jgi:hypothetical protein